MATTDHPSIRDKRTLFVGLLIVKMGSQKNDDILTTLQGFAPRAGPMWSGFAVCWPQFINVIHQNIKSKFLL
jgi:hypothetical protein